MSKNSIVRIGPFGEAKQNVEALDNNLYFNTLYMQTLERFQEIQKEYEAAILHGDEDMIDKTSKELRFIEEVIKLSAVNYENYDTSNHTAND